MRILVFSQHFWPETFRINDVVRALGEAGHEVHVLTGQPNYPSGRVFDGYRALATGTQPFGRATVHRVPLVPRGPGGAGRLVANYLSFIASAAVFGAWRLRGLHFDVIFVYATSPLLQALAAIALAWIKRCALVIWVQDLWPESLRATGYVTNPRVLAATEKVVRFIYRHSTRLLVQSAAFLPSVRTLAPADVPILVHPNPGEDDRPEARAPLLRLAPGFNVVFAGNLGAAQSLDTLIEAAERLRDTPEVRLVLLGSGSRAEWLAQQVLARALDNVVLPGRVDPADVLPILSQAQALLVSLAPDPAMALTVPSKVQTYLAAGRPIVAALDGEGARIVREAGAGVTASPGNADALAEAIRQLVRMSESERAALGRAGRAYFDAHFAPAHLTPALVAHLEAAARERQ